MIGKAKSNVSLAKTIDYQLKQASELFYANNLVGENIDDYRMQMEDLEKCYTGYGKQLLIHTILSPSIEDGQKLDKEAWTKMADMYLQELRLKENHQAMGFIHRDKEHVHCHIVVSKINMDNYKLFQDSFIGKRTQHIADRIAKKFGLVRAMDIKKKNLKNTLTQKENNHLIVNEEMPKGIRQKFKQELKQINERKFQNSETYFQVLKDKGFEVIRHYDDQRNLRGYSLEKDNTMLNATTIGKEFSLRKLGLMDSTNDKTINLKIEKEEQQKIQNFETIQPLDNPKQKNLLYQFFEEQGIDKNTIDKSNIEFIRHTNHFYAAVKNNSGGYAIINPFTSDNIGTKDIATIGNAKDADVIVCEDIFDYLRQLQSDTLLERNYIVLNEIFDKAKLKTEIKRLQPKQLLYNNHEQNHTNNISKSFTHFMDILFSDEHLYQAPVNDFYEHKRKKKLKPHW